MGAYWGVSAPNLDDMANAYRYARAVWVSWRNLYNDLVAAQAATGTDQNKIDAMRVVIDDFDEPANWPGTNIPL